MATIMGRCKYCGTTYYIETGIIDDGHCGRKSCQARFNADRSVAKKTAAGLNNIEPVVFGDKEKNGVVSKKGKSGHVDVTASDISMGQAQQDMEYIEFPGTRRSAYRKPVKGAAKSKMVEKVEVKNGKTEEVKLTKRTSKEVKKTAKKSAKPTNRGRKKRTK